MGQFTTLFGEIAEYMIASGENFNITPPNGKPKEW
jgi:hypothetical protein